MTTTNAAWARRAGKALLRNYAQAPLAFAKGEGCTLWDVEGRAYLDFAAGVAVCSTGHAHPRVTAAVAKQAARLGHVSNLYLVPQQIELAERLASLSGLDGGAFFCNSGTEAVEAAIKLARVWGGKHGGRTDVIATTNSFHGRTMGALTATGQAKYRTPFEPLLLGFSHVPFGDLDATAAAVTEKTTAILVEPVQGEGGVQVPPPGYIKGLRALCDERGLLLILDEVQTGIGRTGAWFAFQHAGVKPDVVALAKGLGSGFPIGAILASPRAAVFEPGHHASTFGGNPLACAAALATLDVIESEGVLGNVRDRGQQLLEGLQALERNGRLANPRGLGLLVAFDLVAGTAADASKALLGAGLLVTTVGTAGIRLAPPLVVASDQVDRALGLLEAALPPATAAEPAR